MPDISASVSTGIRALHRDFLASRSPISASVSTAASIGVGVSGVSEIIVSASVSTGSSIGVLVGSSSLVVVSDAVSTVASIGVSVESGIEKTVQASASTGASIGTSVSASHYGPLSASISSGASVGVLVLASSTGLHSGSISVGAIIGTSVFALVQATVPETVSSGASVGTIVRLSVNLKQSVSSGASIGVSASSSIRVSRSISSGLSIGTSVDNTRSFSVSVTSGASASVAVSGRSTFTLVSSGATIGGSVSAYSVLPDGTVSFGGNHNGPRRLLIDGLHSEFPFCYAETPTVVLAANGVDPMVAWSPQTGKARVAGVESPLVGPLLGGTGVGLITGERAAFVRFIDDLGRPGNLSPISNTVVMGRDGSIDDIVVSSDTGDIFVRSDGHGITHQDYVVFRGIDGLSIINGVQQVTPLDANTLRVDSAKSTYISWGGGGSWTLGVSTVVYSSVPTPSRPNVARRQVLRNSEGNLDVLYVDIDTTDLSSSTLSSSRLDDELTSQEPVPLTDLSGMPIANRHAPPPSHKSAITSFASRVFAAGDVDYKEGCVSASPGSLTVTGIGTSWPSTFVGRQILIDGCEPRTIVALSGQTATLDGPIIGRSRSYSRYRIAPHPGEALTIYYSEPGEPESWPEANGFSVPDDGDGDRITGLFSSGGYLYVVMERHVYRVVIQGTPQSGGTTFMVARRGCINNRCIVQVEDAAYMLDRGGVFSLGADDLCKHISSPVQPLFRSGGSSPVQIDWSADTRLWHGHADIQWETIRWFVSVVGRSQIDTAICYNYRSGSWWIERYPWSVSSSSLSSIGGALTVIAGSEARSVIAMWSSSGGDIQPESGTIFGTVSSADETTITDESAAFGSSLAGCTVTISHGTGEGQTRIISDSTADTITVVKSWDTVPDSTSEYVIGGIQWKWDTPWMRLSGDQTGNPRAIEILYSPTQNASYVDSVSRFDNNQNPRAWYYSSSDDGVSTQSGSPKMRFSTESRDYRSGYSLKRIDGHMDEQAYGDLFVSHSFSGVKGSEPISIRRITIDGVESS